MLNILWHYEISPREGLLSSINTVEPQKLILSFLSLTHSRQNNIGLIIDILYRSPYIREGPLYNKLKSFKIIKVFFVSDDLNVDFLFYNAVFLV